MSLSVNNWVPCCSFKHHKPSLSQLIIHLSSNSASPQYILCLIWQLIYISLCVYFEYLSNQLINWFTNLKFWKEPCINFVSFSQCWRERQSEKEKYGFSALYKNLIIPCMVTKVEENGIKVNLIVPGCDENIFIPIHVR